MIEKEMNTKKVIRRALALILAAVIAVSLAACGGGKGSDSGSGSKPGKSGKTSSSDGPSMPEITIKDGVVRTKEAKIDDPDFSADGLQVLAMENDRIYGFSYSYEGDGFSGNEIVSFKSDGSDLKRKTLDTSDNEEVSASAFYGGNFLLGMALYSDSEAKDYVDSYEEDGIEIEEEDIPDELSEDAYASFELRSVTPDGKVNWKVKIEPADASYYYISGIYASENGVMVVSNEGVDLYSLKDGSYEKKLCKTDSETFDGVLYALADGTVIMLDDTSMNNKVKVYDEASGEFTEKMVLPSALQSASIFPGSKYSFYIASEDGIYAVDLGSGELYPIVNYVNSDLDAQGTLKVIELEDGKLLIQAYSSDNKLGVYILEPVAPEDVEDKKELTLGGYYIDSEVRTQVIDFNKESSSYRIKILDYSQYDLDSDFSEENISQDTTGLTRLNTDIATGSAPDIMLLSPEMPVNSFISKGVLLDITDRYESDKEIDKSDFLQNVVDAFRTNDKMFVVVPGFTIVGVSGKAKYIGDGKDLTLDKVKEIAKSKGISESSIFGLTDRASVFSSAVEFSGDQFIDSETNTCDFNNKEFREILEFAKSCPESISEDQYNDYFTQYLSDSSLLAVQYINTLFDYYYMTRQLFGDVNVTVTGFPSANNKGPAIASSTELGISSNAADPDGCWQFVRRFLTSDYQMSIESALPISEKAIQAQGQRIIDQNRMEAAQDEEMDMLDGIDYEEDMSGDLVIDEDAMGGATIEESEDLTGKIVKEEDFDGTHEEYEEYLKEEEALAKESSTSENAEEVIISGDDIMEEAADGPEDTLSSLPEFSQTDIDAIMGILKGLKFQVNGETEVLKIIKEEAAAYFAGQKAAEEVSDIIQSRVQVYLKENE